LLDVPSAVRFSRDLDLAVEREHSMFTLALEDETRQAAFKRHTQYRCDEFSRFRLDQQATVCGHVDELFDLDWLAIDDLGTRVKLLVTSFAVEIQQ